jgi:hypothetical protein
LRRGHVTFNEYIQVGKGRDVGFNDISKFEAKVANGNGEQTISRDIYRLGQGFDFFRMLSCYYTTVGFYFNNLVRSLSLSLVHTCIIIVYVYVSYFCINLLYGQIQANFQTNITLKYKVILNLR